MAFFFFQTQLRRSKRSVREATYPLDVSRNAQDPTTRSWLATMLYHKSDFKSSSRQNRDSRLKRVCNLEITIDHTLFQAKLSEHREVEKAHKVILQLVASHTASATEIFENTNFNGIEGISFVVQRIHVRPTNRHSKRNTFDYKLVYLTFVFAVFRSTPVTTATVVWLPLTRSVRWPWMRRTCFTSFPSWTTKTFAWLTFGHTETSRRERLVSPTWLAPRVSFTFLLR